MHIKASKRKRAVSIFDVSCFNQYFKISFPKDDEEEGKRVRLLFAWEFKGKGALDRLYRDNVLTTPTARRQFAFVSDGAEDSTEDTRTRPPQNYLAWAISREYTAV